MGTLLSHLLVFALLLGIRVADGIAAQALYFGALDRGILEFRGLDGLASSRHFAILTGFWNVFWWLLLVLVVVSLLFQMVRAIATYEPVAEPEEAELVEVVNLRQLQRGLRKKRQR